MASQIIAKLIELAYNGVQSDLADHEIEDRLIDELVGKSLDFTTEQGDKGTILFHSIGQGKHQPSTVVCLQVTGIEFQQEPKRLSRDMSYIFYKAFGEEFLHNGTKFLITTPAVQKLGPSNILIEFVMFGNTIHQINRCLAIFAEVIRKHQSELHLSAINMYDHTGSDSGDGLDVSLEEPIDHSVSQDTPMEYLSAVSSEEVYIEEYIRYIDGEDREFRGMIDNRNTFAESEFK